MCKIHSFDETVFTASTIAYMTGINRKARGMIVTVRMGYKSGLIDKTLKLEIMIKNYCIHIKFSNSDLQVF